MSITVPVETARQDLDALLDRLSLGETATLVGEDGTPKALIVQLQSTVARQEPQPGKDWLARWDELTRQITAEWKSDKSAVEIVSEMRR
jgi:hypothetical protein